MHDPRFQQSTTEKVIILLNGSNNILVIKFKEYHKLYGEKSEVPFYNILWDNETRYTNRVFSVYWSVKKPS